MIRKVALRFFVAIIFPAVASVGFFYGPYQRAAEENDASLVFPYKTETPLRVGVVGGEAPATLDADVSGAVANDKENDSLNQDKSLLARQILPDFKITSEEESLSRDDATSASNVADAKVADADKTAKLVWQNVLLKFQKPALAALPVSSLFTSNTPLFLKAAYVPDIFPLRNWGTAAKEIDGEAVFAIEMPGEKVLYDKNSRTPRAIASITKLATALVAVESLPLEEEVRVSAKAVATQGEAGGFFVDEVLTVRQLLYALLLESSNDAAAVLEETFNLYRTAKEATFIRAMNEKAKKIGMLQAQFMESTGLDPQNTASAEDVAKLMQEAYANKELRAIMAEGVYKTVSKNGIAHRWVNLNTLLGTLPGVVGGKTGYTPEAGESMAVVTRLREEGEIITVVLGAQNRVTATTELINWLKEAYLWR